MAASYGANNEASRSFLIRSYGRMPDHVNTLKLEDQEKWMHQRGWTPVERHGQRLWRDPDRGVTYRWDIAFQKAKDDCRLPADLELTPQ
jgi:hypothetical protein